MHPTDFNLDERLRAVCASVFNLEPSRLGDDASPETIAEWDSLGHLTLVLAVEAEFGVSFEADEIPTLNTFSRIRERVGQG
jgi:acyl carrier protein